MSAKTFATIFRGLEEAFGTYEINSTKANGKQTGQAKIVRESRTEAHWEGHLSGKGASVGIIPINADNNCVWGCVDIDQYNFNHKELIDKIREKKLPLVVCRSKSGGAHVFLFANDWMPAKDMQEVLRHIASALGYSGSEIFPKQVKLQLDRGDVGNFLNMPYYDAEDGLRYAIKDDGTAATLEEFFELHKAFVQTPEQILALQVQKEDNLPVPDGPPCLQLLCTQGFPEGTRNNGLFNVGVYLRKSHPDTWEDEVAKYNHQYMNPPLPLAEVNIIVKQLNRKDYVYKCNDAPINDYCNKELCLTRKFGVGSAGNNAAVANLRKYASTPPVWFMDVNGEPLELDTDALLNQNAFQKACVEQLNFMPPTSSKPLWEARINALLRDMTETEGGVIETSQDASLEGAFYDYLEDFCRNMQTAQDKEEILLRRPWTDEDTNQTFFRLRDFENYLKRNRFFDFKTHKIAQRLRDINGEPTTLRIKERTVRVWRIPALEASGTDVRTPDFARNEEDIPF
tara:strand:- start:2879 stop:4417 length:1539 start_codon:yes stop_codon:yes gene_type:complete